MNILICGDGQNDDNVEFIDKDIFQVKGDAVVCPCDCFGFIDNKYVEYFGFTFEFKFRKKLKDFFYGEIPIGQTLILESRGTDFKDYPYVIFTPTIFSFDISEHVLLNDYIAFRGAILSVINFNIMNPSSKINKIVSPSFKSSKNMVLACKSIFEKRKIKDKSEVSDFYNILDKDN